jgi:hypothetical protein
METGFKTKKLKMMRIYLKENDLHDESGSHSYKYIIKKLKEHDISGATVFKGIYGYGKKGVAEMDIIRLSMNLPIVIECVDCEEKINDVLPVIHKIISGNGLIMITDILAVDDE